jgi:hypothetical protein
VELTTMRGGNVTQRKDIFVTLSDTNPSDDIVSLQDLLRMVAAQTTNFCRSMDSLMNCLDPYLATCFPEPASSSDVSMNQFDDQDQSSSVPAAQLQDPQQQQTQTPATSNQTVDTQDNDVDIDDYFFQIPMMTTQKQINYFIRQAFGLLCGNDAQAFKAAIDSLPCLMSTVSQQNCKRFDDAVDLIQDLMDANNSTGPNPDICGAMRNAAECHLDLAFENCGQSVASIGQAIYQFYFESVNCVEAPGSNSVVSVRQPFNQMIL